MANTVTLATDARNAACNATVDLVDVGASPAYILIRGGTTTLVTLVLPNPAFGSAANGTAGANGLPISGVCTTPGFMDNYEVHDRSGALLWSGSIGLAASNPAMVVDGTAIALSQGFVLNAWSHTVP
jgi:hypothetical protein